MVGFGKNQGLGGSRKGLEANPFPCSDKFYTFHFHSIPRQTLEKYYSSSTLKCTIHDGVYYVWACAKKRILEWLFGKWAYQGSPRELIEVHSPDPNWNLNLCRENSEDSTAAEEGYKHFHGVESSQIISDAIDWPPPVELDREYGPFDPLPKNLTVLGELLAVQYEDKETLDEEIIEFSKPYPILASDYQEYDEGEEELYVVGGKYKVHAEPNYICGPLIWVEYRTVKSFDDLKPVAYKHRFNDPWPILAQNKARNQLYILRGDSEFYVDRSQPVSGGIVG